MQRKRSFNDRFESWPAPRLRQRWAPIGGVYSVHLADCVRRGSLLTSTPLILRRAGPARRTDHGRAAYTSGGFVQGVTTFQLPLAMVSIMRALASRDRK